MNLILEAEGRQFTAHQGIQSGHREVGARHGLHDVGSWQGMILTFSQRTGYGWRCAPTLRTVQEEIDARDVLMEETDRLEDVDNPGKIVAADHQVHILGVPGRLPCSPAPPGSHGVAPDDDMWDAGIPQRQRHDGSLANLFHGGNHPLQENSFSRPRPSMMLPACTRPMGLMGGGFEPATSTV